MRSTNICKPGSHRKPAQAACQRQRDMFGQQGDDALQASSGSNYLYGNEGNDVLTGGTGSDYLYGDAGIDTTASTT